MSESREGRHGGAEMYTRLKRGKRTEGKERKHRGCQVWEVTPLALCKQVEKLAGDTQLT